MESDEVLLRVVEIIRYFKCLIKRQYKERSYDIKNLNASSYNLSTTFPQKVWKSGSLIRLVMLTLCLFTLVSCSLLYGRQQFGKTPPPAQLMGRGEEEIRKQLGEPTNINKTPDSHLLYVYRREWKIMPDDKGTLFVEFADGKVIKVFEIK